MAHARRLPMLALAVALLACSSNSRDDDKPAGLGAGGSGASGGSGGTNAATGATGGAAASSGAGAVIGVAGTTGETGGTGGIDACVGEKSTGELVPVDLFVMLDISGSMTDLTEDGTDKWTRVKEALTAFLTDESSAGLGVGIQYFPLTKPGVPSTCTNNEGCGDAGPCFLKLCWRALQEDLGVFACEEDAECEVGPTPADDFGPCVPYGRCENDDTFICPNAGEACVSLDPDADLGTCVPPVSACLNGYECGVESYAAAAVEIATLPDAAQGLLASIEAQTPNGQTPTGPALAGAIEHVLGFAARNPDHTVAVLFATDGLPTQCEPQEIAPISELAAAGMAATPSVRTFVIGVFGPLDVDAPANLDAIALAGGTESAFMVDTSGDVGTQFLAALAEIRGTQLTCEFQIPAPEAGQELDYGLVNVVYTRDAVETRLARVADAAACGTEGGWFYDDPDAPTRIVVCPSDCTTFQSQAGGSVEIELGCTTTIR